jgi:hypothetical protein
VYGNTLKDGCTHDFNPKNGLYFAPIWRRIQDLKEKKADNLKTQLTTRGEKGYRNTTLRSRIIS